MTQEEKATDLNAERKFMEEVLNQRFNFFLLFFSIIVAGAVTTQSDVLFCCALSLGAFVSVFLSLAIYRSYWKQP